MKKQLTERQRERRNAFKDWLKSMIFPLILFAIIAAGILFVINYKEEEEPVEIVKVNAYAGGEDLIVLENDKLKFTMDPLTTYFDVLVKSTGKVWHSVPERAGDDTLAKTSEKGKLKSTLVLTYSTTNGLEVIQDNYAYSIENGIYEIETSGNSVKINYSIGDVEKEFVVPTVIRKRDLDALYENMSKADINMVDQSYKSYNIDKLGKKDNKEELLENYPVLAEEPIYVLRNNVNENMKGVIQDRLEAAGYTYEAYLADKELDNKVTFTEKPVFNLSMIYTLDGDELKVEIPYSSIENRAEYPVYYLSILPYFGAGYMDEEGFILVPEGGGALINFNNGKTVQNAYYANVYGWDYALSRKDLVHNTSTAFNAFGISSGNDSFICTLEEGAPYAAVQADVSGRYNNFNSVNATYNVYQREQFDVSQIANTSVYTYVPELPDESIVQTYHFVSSGKVSEMAKEYQKYLSNKVGTEVFDKNQDSSVPVALEIVGAIDKVKQIVGVPVSRPHKLTTFSEAGEIIDKLYNEGVTNMDVKLSGWFNGGITQKILKKVNVISDLGGKKALQNMISSASSKGVDVYLDGITQYAYDSTLVNGFFSFRDAAKFISKERAVQHVFSDVTYSAREGFDDYYLIHADLQRDMIKNLANYAKSNNANVSFRDLGMDLSSDFYRKNFVSRQQALYNQIEDVKEIRNAGTGIMINEGNDYILPYADMVTKMKLQGHEYTIIDEYVPFYQIAIHGYVNYTGAPLNICGRLEDELLRSAAYGAGLAFTVMAEDNFAIQKTMYTEYYGSDFNAWHDELLSIYTRYNNEMGHVFNQEITDFENLSETVSCTTYEDGTKVYVNYGYSDYSEGSITVPARDYKVVK